MERFEEIDPNALSVFLDEAKKRGIYRGLRKHGGGQNKAISVRPERRAQTRSSKYDRYIVQRNNWEVNGEETQMRRYNYYMNKLNEQETLDTATFKNLNRKLQITTP